MAVVALPSKKMPLMVMLRVGWYVRHPKDDVSLDSPNKCLPLPNEMMACVSNRGIRHKGSFFYSSVFNAIGKS